MSRSDHGGGVAASDSFLLLEHTPTQNVGDGPGACVEPLPVNRPSVGTFYVKADGQKLAFLREMKKRGLKNQVCNVGLWRYSRHPNYFAEWMVWNALVIAAIPSWLARYGHDNIAVWLLLGLGLVNVSRLMYITLVHYTGAKPAEYFSVQKRPAYKAYQQTTNMFFPGPVKPTGNDTDS